MSSTQAIRNNNQPKQDRTPLEPTVRSSKVQDQHLKGLAIVYVRQSSPQQVQDHRESTLRQYSLVDYATALGWPTERVLVIDDDQGQSGKYADDREGFQRVLTEVGLDHVGIVLGLEMSRLARSDKDWHHLIEVCGIFGTLLADQDGVYDAADPNDRLLLGLKGTISSVELQTMRNRLEKGKLNKAMRGELFLDVPVGYVKQPNGELAFDPDEQARAAVTLIFEKFDELGAGAAVFRYMLEHGIRLGIRPHDGPNRGQLEWRPPCLTTLYRILQHPFYAGTYAYGRFPQDPKLRSKKTGRCTVKRVPMDEWKVKLHDAVPAYISWDTYLRNQERFRQNASRWETTGAPRDGSALLGGLVTCGQCGCRMQVRYTGTEGRYDCIQHLRHGQPRTCHGLSSSVVDEFVRQQVMRALQPAAIELCLKACDDIEKERKRLGRHWQQQLERARYESGQAHRPYQAVDPENRLVARTRERDWEQALQNERQLEEEYDRFRLKTPLTLTEEEQQRIQSLTNDLPALWESPDTTAIDRKEIIRCLVERVVIQVQGNTEYVDVSIHWAGGFSSQAEIIRPIAEYRQMRDYDRFVQRLHELRDGGCTAKQIADTLDLEGFRPPGKQKKFSHQTVRQLLSRWGLGGERPETVELQPNEWWLSDLARKLSMSSSTARRWIKQEWVHFRRSPQHGYYIIWADDEEMDRLTQLRAAAKSYPRTTEPALTTPKQRAPCNEASGG